MGISPLLLLSLDVIKRSTIVVRLLLYLGRSSPSEVCPPCADSSVACLRVAELPWCRRLAVRPGVVSFRPVWFSVCGSVSLSSLGPRTVASRVYLGPKKLSLSLSLPLAR